MTIGTPVSNDDQSYSNPLTTTADAPAGSLILITVFSTALATGVTDSAGNIYQQAIQKATPQSSTPYTSIWWSLTQYDLPLGSSITVAGTSAGDHYPSNWVATVTGTFGGIGPTYFQSSAAAQTSGFASSGVIPLPASTNLVFGILNPANSGYKPYVEGAGFTTLNTAEIASGGDAAISCATMGNVTFTWAPSWTNAETWSTLVATFMGALYTRLPGVGTRIGQNSINAWARNRIDTSSAGGKLLRKVLSFVNRP